VIWVPTVVLLFLSEFEMNIERASSNSFDISSEVSLLLPSGKITMVINLLCAMAA
jgi:hypothetical protein